MFSNLNFNRSNEWILLYLIVQLDFTINLLDYFPENPKRREIFNAFKEYYDSMKAKGFELKSHWDKTVWEGELLDELCKEDGYNVYRAYTTTTCRTMDGKYFPNVANTLEICVKEQS